MSNGTATALAPEQTREPIIQAPRSETLRTSRVETESLQRLVHFRRGLLGFPDCRQYVLRSTERFGLYWLQSTEHDTLAFLLADPFVFVRDYVVEVGDAVIAELEPAAPTDLAAFAIVTIPATRDEPCTLNLQGPLMIDLRSGRGKQIVLAESDFGLRHPVDFSNY